MNITVSVILSDMVCMLLGVKVKSSPRIRHISYSIPAAPLNRLVVTACGESGDVKPKQVLK